jgi:hypothetical protein
MQIQGKLLIFGVFFVALPYCSADLVPTSISEQVSSAGNIFYCPHGIIDIGSCVSDSFNVGASNNQLGPYHVSKSGQAALTTLFGDFTAGASAGQTSNVNAANISVDMGADSRIDGTANHIGPNTAVSNQFLFQFDLTSPVWFI